MAPLAGPLHRIVGRILRSRDKAGAGTLELISGNDDAKFEYASLLLILFFLSLSQMAYHVAE